MRYNLLNSKSDEAVLAERIIIEEIIEEELLQKEVFPPATTTSLSIGDIVTIKGLVNAPKYNGMRGVIVSAVDVTTNRCGVSRITGGNNVSKVVMAIQVTNLTLDRRAKKSTRNVDGIWRHLAIACTFCDEEERLTLVEQNISFLQTCEDAVAILTLHNGLLGPRLLVPIIKKWREQASMGFVRFLNGNMTDWREENLQFILLRDALLHFDVWTWTVDWDINLTEMEIAFVTKPVVRQLLVHHEWHEAEDGTDASNNQRGHSSPPLVLATEREVPSARAVPTTDFVNNDSYSTKQVANIMKNFRKCKQGAVNIILSNLRAGECNSFLLCLVDNGLIPVILGLLRQCEHKEFNEMVKKVKGNLRTPVDWITILAHLGNVEQCKFEIANGIQAVIRCLCDDSKRLFFMSNKYWHEAVPLFFDLLLNLLQSSGDSSSTVTAATVSNILLQNEGFLDSVVQTAFWSSYRPDLVKEYESHQLSVDVKTLEAFAHKVIRNIVSIGLKRVMAQIPFPQDGLDLIMTIAKTPIVSRSYEPDCKVNLAVGMIRMLKNVVDRGIHFDTLHMSMLKSDCVDNDVIADVIDLGRNFTVNIDDAMSISKISYVMLVRKAQRNIYPIDERLAFAIKSGLLEMCFEFLSRFECDPVVQSIACDAQRNQLMEALVYIADLIQNVALHQNTSKAIRDRRSHIMEALKPLINAEKSHLFQFLDILVSIMDLNEGSCSRCNKLIERHTSLFCEGCRRVAYCGVKCQKMDWRHGTHSSYCSFLARSANELGLTTFEAKSSRNKSKLAGLSNNIVTSQKKLFLRHQVSIFSQLLNYQDQSDYIAVFDLSNMQHPQGRDEVNLYVGNLSFYTDEEGVRNMFEAHGAVTDCFIPIERGSCRPRGFAFVTMPAKDAEVACAKVNGSELDGHTLRVNVYMEAQPKGEYTLRHYHDQFTCMKQRKWFEGLRLSDKLICMFTSGVFNGEFDDEGNVNIISLFAVFPFSNHIQLVRHME